MAVNENPKSSTRSQKQVIQRNVTVTGATPATLMTFSQLPTGTVGNRIYARPVIMRMSGFMTNLTMWIRTGTSGSTAFGPATAGTETVSFNFQGPHGICTGDWDQGLFISGSGGGTFQATLDITYETTSSIP